MADPIEPGSEMDVDEMCAMLNKLEEQLVEARVDSEELKVELDALKVDRDEWKARFERVIDKHPEGAWMAKAIDAERERNRLSFQAETLAAALTAGVKENETILSALKPFAAHWLADDAETRPDHMQVGTKGIVTVGHYRAARAIVQGKKP